MPGVDGDERGKVQAWIWGRFTDWDRGRWGDRGAGEGAETWTQGAAWTSITPDACSVDNRLRRWDVEVGGGVYILPAIFPNLLLMVNLGSYFTQPTLISANVEWTWAAVSQGPDGQRLWTRTTICLRAVWGESTGSIKGGFV